MLLLATGVYIFIWPSGLIEKSGPSEKVERYLEGWKRERGIDVGSATAMRNSDSSISNREKDASSPGAA